MKQFDVELLTLTSGQTEQGVFELGDPGPGDCKLSLRRASGEILKTERSDFFECLRDIRRKLESQGIRPLCGGARRDVWATGLLRQGGGWNAMLFPLDLSRLSGHGPTLVNIFHPASPSEVVSVEEQWDYMNRWFETHHGCGMSPSTR